MKYYLIFLLIILIPFSSAAIKYEYQFDEGSGVTLFDTYGRANGTIYGSPQWVSGLNGSALNFTNNSYQKVVLNSSFSMPTNAKSISVWAYPRNNNGNYEAIIHTGTSTVCQTFSIVWRNQQFGIQGNTVGCDMTSVSGTSALNTWHHIVAVQENATKRLIYIDGVNLANLSTTSFAFTMSAENQTIGNNGQNTQPFSGMIDKALYFDHALTPQEVLALYTDANITSNYIFGLCNATVTTPVLNVTFTNETIAQQRINSTLTATLSYNNGTGVTTYNFQNLTANKEYDFCGYSSYYPLGIYGNGTFVYYNSESPQRTYTYNVFNFTNIVTNLSLLLLPYSDGTDIAFQVVSPSNQVIEGATVNVTRSGYGLIEQKVTDSSGAVSFFLNPLVSYQVCGYSASYGSSCYTITPSQSSYTIYLGTNTLQNYTGYYRGVNFSISPSNASLLNNTNYTFSFGVTSDYYALTLYGFSIKNKSNSILSYISGSSSGGGVVTSNINTQNNSQLTMEFFWIANGSSINMTRDWIVVTLEGNQYSLNNAKNNLLTYLRNSSDSDGLYGLSTNQNNGFSFTLIVFFFIFILTGMVTYRYGVSNPAAILTVMFLLTYIFDVVLNVIPTFNNSAISHLPTYFIGLIALLLIVREEMQ